MSRDKKENLKIWFKEPAVNFIEGTPDNPSPVNGDGRLGDNAENITALPIGNGRLGGLIFGGIEEELIKINEDTLWSGEPKETNDDKWVNYLPEVRSLVFEGKYEEADKLSKIMQGPWNESYMALGNLRIKFIETNNVENYSRELDLQNAVARVNYDMDGAHYSREYFCSNPSELIIIRFSCSKPGKVSFDARFDSQLKHKMICEEENTVILKGIAPYHVEPNYMGEMPNAIVYDEKNEKGMSFEAQLKLVYSNGSICCDEEGMHVKGADEVVLFLAAATSFNGFDKSPSLEGKNSSLCCKNNITKALEKDYEHLLKEHIEDYKSLFNRVELSLGESTNEKLPTDIRLKKFRNGEEDLGIYELFFNFGRYLLIASSRPGTMPANLQGIWNEEVRPPWSDNWTGDINVEMNYWLAESCNLAECHKPLIDLVDRLRINGRKTAKAYYGSKGWVSGLNIDIWHTTSPVGNGEGTPTWANWLMSGPWLCQHVWAHYEYSLDKEYLKEKAYPILKECAQFLLENLFEDKDGYLVTNPATSPERTFKTADGQKASVSAGTTMDMTLTRELFTNVIEAGKVLNTDREFISELEKAKEKLLPYKIGRLGQLQEWSQDWDEPNLVDSHCSFLYGLYPGSDITPKATPELAKASAVSLGFRGMCLQGWGLAWRISLWARLMNSKKSLEALDLLISKLIAPNLFGKIYPDGLFQIDGNFGGTAGIAEMLLQSTDNEIKLLPALPEKFKDGYVKGLRAKGGFEVDIYWQEGSLTRAFIKSIRGGVCRITAPSNVVVKLNDHIVESKIADYGVVEFITEPNEEYIIIVK